MSQLPTVIDKSLAYGKNRGMIIVLVHMVIEYWKSRKEPPKPPRKKIWATLVTAVVAGLLFYFHAQVPEPILNVVTKLSAMFP